MEIQGKVALITGAARGIGLETTNALLKNGLKGITIADILCIEGNEEVKKLQNEYGKDKVIFIKLDVSNREEFKNVFETTIKTFGQLDIVINNAGIVNELDWSKCVSVNLIGTLNGCFLAEHYLLNYKSTNDSVVINISSITALQPVSFIPTYSATKSAVLSLATSLGKGSRFGNTKIRVITICPGRTDTKFAELEDKVQEPYLSERNNVISPLYTQKPQAVAAHIVDLIKNAESGTVWIAMDDKLTSVKLTNYLTI